MKPAPFAYSRPQDIDAALMLLSQQGPGSALLAGGQSLVPLMNLRARTPAHVIDINRLPGLDRIAIRDEVLTIGAMARQSALLSSEAVAAHAPLLREACRHVGHAPTRNRGTLGGSIAHGDPSAELPMACLALGASLTIRSSRETRTILIDRFYFEPAAALKPDEIIVSVSIRIAAAERQAFDEFALGGKCIVCGAIVSRDGKVRLALGGYAATYVVMEAGTGEAARQFQRTLESVAPLSDHHAGAGYRRHLASILIGNLLGKADAA